MVDDLLKQHRLRQAEAKLQASETWQKHGLVFCKSLGTPLNPNKVIDRFKTLLKKANLPATRFHDLRHGAATILLSVGVHPIALCSHDTLQITQDCLYRSF